MASQISIRNPFDNTEIASIALADEVAIDAAIAQANSAFESTRRLAPFERSKLLSNAAGLLAKRRDDFAAMIVAEAGKPITLAEAEVDRAIVTLTAAAEEARHAQGEWLDLDGFASGKGHIGFVKRFPIGVIYGITPFNFPLNLVLHKVAPVVATGNTIIVKPSPRTPISAMKIAELFREAGSPMGQVVVVVAPNELAMRPIADPRIRHISFTGSAPIGWEIKRKAGEKRVTLELGGNAALIVHDDADLDAAVEAAAKGAFGYAGQSCISVQRILVQSRVYDEFRARFLAYVEKNIHCGDPRDKSILVGPMIDATAIQRVLGVVNEAMRSGARLLIGGEAVGPCLKPTVLENVDLKSQICTSEIFAPVATLHRYDDFGQAIAIANDSAYGLQAGVFTRDISRAWHAFESLEVGGVMINQAPTWRSDTMPYGGVKQSGFGREGIRYAMQEMTDPRTLVMRI